MLLLSAAFAAELVVLADGGVLYETPDKDASAPWAGQALTLEVLETRDDWLHVRTQAGCATLVEVDVWVRADSVVPAPEQDELADCVYSTSGTVQVRKGDPLTNREGVVVGHVRADGQLEGRRDCLVPFGGEMAFCQPSFVVIRDDARMYRSPEDNVGFRYGRGADYLAMQVTGESEERVQVAFVERPEDHCHGSTAPRGLAVWIDHADLQTVTTTEAAGVLPGAVVLEDGVDTGRMHVEGALVVATGTRYRPEPRVPPMTDTSLVADDEGWLGDLDIDGLNGEVTLIRGDQVAAVQTGRRTVVVQDRCAKLAVKTWRAQIRPFYIPEFSDPTVPLPGMTKRLEMGTPLFWVEGPVAGYAREELKLEEVEGTCGTLRVGEDQVRVCW
jgi:hypothetical protein